MMNSQNFSDAASSAGETLNALGEFADDTMRQARGAMDQGVAEVQKTYGKAVDQTKSFTSDQPTMALLAAMGVGVILGFALGTAAHKSTLFPHPVVLSFVRRLNETFGRSVTNGSVAVSNCGSAKYESDRPEQERRGSRRQSDHVRGRHRGRWCWKRRGTGRAALCDSARGSEEAGTRRNGQGK